MRFPAVVLPLLAVATRTAVSPVAKVVELLQVIRSEHTELSSRFEEVLLSSARMAESNDSVFGDSLFEILQPEQTTVVFGGNVRENRGIIHVTTSSVMCPRSYTLSIARSAPSPVAYALHHV